MKARRLWPGVDVYNIRNGEFKCGQARKQPLVCNPSCSHSEAETAIRYQVLIGLFGPLAENALPPPPNAHTEPPS